MRVETIEEASESIMEKVYRKSSRYMGKRVKERERKGASKLRNTGEEIKAKEGKGS